MAIDMVTVDVCPAGITAITRRRWGGGERLGMCLEGALKTTPFAASRGSWPQVPLAWGEEGFRESPLSTPEEDTPYDMIIGSELCAGGGSR